MHVIIWSHRLKTALKQMDLEFNIIARGTYSQAENILCSDTLHQPTKIYEICDT